MRSVPFAFVLSLGLACCTEPPSGAGRIELTDDAYGASARLVDVGAAFGSPPLETDPCTRTVVGACTLAHCPSAPWPDWGAPRRVASPDRVSAGALTLEVDGVITPLDGSADLPAGIEAGQRVTVVASGDVVPPFEVSLVAPGLPDVEVADMIDRAADLVITWAPTTTTEAVVSILVTADPLISFGGASSSITCTQAAAVGRVTMPREALAMLLADATELSLVATQQVSTRVQAGGFDVELSIAQSSHVFAIPAR